MGSIVRLCAITAAAFVAASLLLFALDETREGSQTQQRAIDHKEQVFSDTEVAALDPAPEVERIREQRHSGVREAIDDVNDVLLSPFLGLVESDSTWVSRLVPAGLGLLLYGWLGMMLANALPRSSREQQDWREATG